MTQTLPFEADAKDPASQDFRGEHRGLLVDVDGFEGPLDLLLSLAREQKVDLTRISIVQLVDQYLGFVAKARSLDLDLAADYLVMAAWLAYLKSRLLLPVREEETEEPPSAQELAELLAFRLRRLEAIQKAGETLMARPRLGLSVFARAPQDERTQSVRTIHDVSLNDLLSAYAGFVVRTSVRTLQIEAADLWSVDDALRRMERLFGTMPDWSVLSAYLPPIEGDTLKIRSATAATFVAALELARQGKVELRQDGGVFSPIRLRWRGGS